MHLPTRSTRQVSSRSRNALTVRSTHLAAVVHRCLVGQAVPRRRHTSDGGQTTAEYGLVILAAGTLALAAILWARSSGSITGLFQNVIDQLMGNVDG